MICCVINITVVNRKIYPKAHFLLPRQKMYIDALHIPYLGKKGEQCKEGRTKGVPLKVGISYKTIPPLNPQRILKLSAKPYLSSLRQPILNYTMQTMHLYVKTEVPLHQDNMYLTPSGMISDLMQIGCLDGNQVSWHHNICIFHVLQFPHFILKVSICKEKQLNMSSMSITASFAKATWHLVICHC